MGITDNEPNVLFPGILFQTCRGILPHSRHTQLWESDQGRPTRLLRWTAQYSSAKNESNCNFEDRYLLGKEIQRGSFGVVRWCFNKATNERFAVKIVDLCALRKRQNLASCVLRSQEDEARLLLEIESTHVLRAIDVFRTKDTIHI